MVLVRSLVAIVVLAVLGDAAATSAIRSGEISGAAKIGRIIRNQDPQEIPIFGSSRAQGSFVPELLAPSAFNYGIDGLGLHAIGFFLEKELQKPRRTPIIVSFDYEWWHTRIGDTSSWVPSAADPEVRSMLGDEFRLRYRLPLVRYYGRFETYAGFALNERFTLTKTVDRGGVFLVAPVTRAKFQAMVDERQHTSFTFAIDGRLDEWFRRLLTAHPERQFVVAVAPYHRAYLKSVRNPEAIAAYLQTLQAIPNVVVIDRAAADYDDDLFMNTSHLNYAGAQRFTRELRADLAAWLDAGRDRDGRPAAMAGRARLGARP
jgi:hypothetical protein